MPPWFVVTLVDFWIHLQASGSITYHYYIHYPVLPYSFIELYFPCAYGLFPCHMDHRLTYRWTNTALHSLLFSSLDTCIPHHCTYIYWVYFPCRFITWTLPRMEAGEKGGLHGLLPPPHSLPIHHPSSCACWTPGQTPPLVPTCRPFGSSSTTTLQLWTFTTYHYLLQFLIPDWDQFTMPACFPLPCPCHALPGFLSSHYLLVLPCSSPYPLPTTQFPRFEQPAFPSY